jgi:protein-S-isoprenylcysteine O-methyltransferase Ste14
MQAKEKDPRNGNKAMTGRSSLRGFGSAMTNILLANCFGLFAFANAKSFFENPRLSVFLIVVTETIVVIFLLIRRDPDETKHSWQTWITSACGTLWPFLLRPTAGTGDLLAGDILQITGFILQIAALLALNRSIGILPAYREIKTAGMYKWVRHPLYTAYIVTYLGYLINNQSLANLSIAIVGTAFLLMRIHYEEELLFKYAEYARYANRIKWRVIPAIW